jgi:multidrug efflux system membrane fusion protein
MKHIIPLNLLAVTLMLITCRSKQEPDKTQTNLVTVKTISVQKSTVSFPIHTSGMLGSKTEMKLSFKTGGIISNILVEEGQSVKRGQELARLNLSEIEAQVNQASLALEKANRDLHRAKNLYNDSVATLEQLQNAQTAVEYANSQLQIARFNKEYSVIVAPANGKILKKLAEPNEVIAPGHPLFLFGSSESDWVLRTALPDVDIVKIQLNDSAKVSFDAFPSQTYRAVVSEMAKSSDPYTGTYEVELRMIRENDHFISGLIGAADIIPAKKETCFGLPVGVLHDANDMSGFVYIVTDSTYERKKVEIVQIINDKVYIDGNLKQGDRIISEGAEYLNPESKIAIVE